jgi:hypothetical protein
VGGDCQDSDLQAKILTWCLPNTYSTTTFGNKEYLCVMTQFAFIISVRDIKDQVKVPSDTP